jgi:hypothetical protein
MVMKLGAGEAPLGVEHGLDQRNRQHQPVELLCSEGRVGNVWIASRGEMGQAG